MSRYTWGVDGFGRAHIIDSETNECVACCFGCPASFIYFELEGNSNELV